METQHPLHKAVAQLKSMDKIDIHGKQYASVASRIEAFRSNFPSATIETILVHNDEQRVVIQARITVEGDLIATGYAEEFRGEGWINSTSALENAETSAIGRSLSACGLLSGSEQFSSADEVTNAVAQQEYTTQNNNQPNQMYHQQQSKAIQSDLSEHGIAIMQKGNMLIANSPDLYSKRTILKQNGYQFNPSTKEWWCYANNNQNAA